VVGLLLFLVGLVLAGVTAFRISTTLGIGYVAVVLIIMGAALSYENDATSEEA
jgi:glucose uptake protein GlcU